MTSTPVNLNKVRKARKRADARRQADENAVKFGLSKKQKDLAREISERDTRKLDASKRER